MFGFDLLEIAEMKTKYEYGVEYPTNGKKPDLPDDVIVEFSCVFGSYYKNPAEVGNWAWENSIKFKIVDERYKPAEPEKRYWDGKEPLEVGMWCLVSGEECEISLLADNNGLYMTNINGFHIGAYLENIKPIDTRTDKERAIYEIYRSDLSVKENLAVAYDKWVGKDDN